MAVASVKKVELYAHRTAVKDILSVLQARGICEISAPEKDSANDAAAVRSSQDSAEYGAALSDVHYLTRFLAPYYKDPVGSLGRMLGERDDMSFEELACRTSGVNVKSMADEVRLKERRQTEVKSEIQQALGLRSTLTGLREFKMPLSMVTEGSRMVAGFLGTGRPEQLAAWKDAVAEALGADAECALSVPGKGEAGIAWGSVFFLRSREEQVQELCLKHSVSKVELPSALTGTVEEELKKLASRLEALELEEKEISAWFGAFAEAHMAEIQRAGDYFANMKERQDAESRSEQTEQVVLLTGWVPVSKEKELKDMLVPFESLAELKLSDPTEDDNPPIVLENRACARPFEMLTVLYGAPVYGAVDPSLPMMPFFLLFFGMCYADAGYGLLIMLIAMHYLRKYKKMPDSIKQALILVKYCGIATIIFGAVTGSWMGDMIDVFPFLSFIRPVKNIVVLLEPMKDPMLLLGISLILGIVHIFFGIFIAAYANIRKGDWFAACADQGGWLILLTGLLIFGAGSAVPSLAVPGKYTAIAGAAILVLTQGREKPSIFGKITSGLLSLYNVTSYLGDVLSYSRLLALGLVGGAVAMIINLMSSLCAGTPYVGWIIAAAIFVGGHIFSIVINILGAFVHPLRLQYVEFFGKFYSSGGTMFNPFCYRTDYVNISGQKDA